MCRKQVFHYTQNHTYPFKLIRWEGRFIADGKSWLGEWKDDRLEAGNFNDKVGKKVSH